MALIAGAAPAAAPQAARPNPFAKKSALPFQAPAFDKITDADFQPAIEEGMRLHLAEIRKIAENPAPPTFQNTFAAMEKAGQMLARVGTVFNCLTGANTDDTLQKIQEEEAPKLAAHSDAIYLNEQLFKRVEAVYAKRGKLKLDPESARLVEYTYQQFVKAGARLSDADKGQLKKLNEEES
ncbi:MAG TPA: hypothetical protein VL181_09670, partial [Holophagaceae bacterium]|nr:hypothetical protein [Holophagaceae bacterium]